MRTGVATWRDISIGKDWIIAGDRDRRVELAGNNRKNNLCRSGLLDGTPIVTGS
jgi:hypothetical protein